MAHLLSVRFNKKFCIIVFFLLSWIAGILAGYFFSSQVGFIHFPLMRSVLNCRVSIISLLLVHTVPFLLIILIVNLLGTPFIAIVLFTKAFLFSSTVFLTSFAFREAGWLIRRMIFLSDALISSYLLHFSIRIADEAKSKPLISFVFVLLCCLIDYHIISPLLGALYI